MKKILLVAFIATTLFACNKEDENVATVNGKASLSVKIDIPKLTRAGDANVANPLAEIAEMILVVKDKNNIPVTTKVVTSNFTSPIVLIEKTNDANLIDGKVYVYAVTAGNDWGTLSESNLPTLATGQLDINKWQKDHTETKGGFVNVPYYGEATIIQDGVNTDSHILLTATVTITPELGRIQILGIPTGGTKTVGTSVITVSDIAITNVYINNIYSNGALVSPRGNGVDDWVSTAFFGTDGSLFSMQDDNSGFGYQVFEGNTPHVIVKITYKTSVDGAVKSDHVGFLTIQKFTYDSIDTGDLTIVKGKIYNVDLGNLTLTYDKIGNEPYDNTIYYDLVANVSIEPWTIINVTPVIP